jgi:hypothetical protein
MRVRDQRTGRYVLDKNLPPRECHACGSTSSINVTSGKINWCVNYDAAGNEIGVLCLKCYSRYIGAPKYNKETNKKYNPIWNPITRNRTLDYRGHTKLFHFDIRCGVCTWCRAVAGIDTDHTSLHHDENMYDYDNPLRYTIELCTRCHNKETFRLRRSAKEI